MDLKIFVLAPDHTRLSRRIKRDTIERGRQAAGVLE